ncbi:MAG: hypothetical protein ACPG5L_07475 [Vibrio gallaecicus]
MLYFIYPDLFFTGSAINFDGNKKNVVTGSRSDTYSETGTNIDFSVSLPTPNSPDVLVYAKANLITYRDVDPHVIITGADDNGFASNTVVEDKAFTRSELLGQYNEDLLHEFTLADKAFWRVRVTSSVSIDHVISKLYLSRKMHLGKEPSAGSFITFDESNRSAKRPVRVITLRYNGITKTNYLAFRQNVIKYKAVNPVFLYAKNYTHPLNGETLIHAKLQKVTVTSKMVDKFNMDLTFRELI